MPRADQAKGKGNAKQLLPALKIMIVNLELNHQDLKVEAVLVKAQSVANSLVMLLY